MGKGSTTTTQGSIDPMLHPLLQGSSQQLLNYQAQNPLAGYADPQTQGVAGFTAPEMEAMGRAYGYGEASPLEAMALQNIMNLPSYAAAGPTTGDPELANLDMQQLMDSFSGREGFFGANDYPWSGVDPGDPSGVIGPLPNHNAGPPGTVVYPNGNPQPPLAGGPSDPGGLDPVTGLPTYNGGDGEPRGGNPSRPDPQVPAGRGAGRNSELPSSPYGGNSPVGGMAPPSLAMAAQPKMGGMPSAMSPEEARQRYMQTVQDIGGQYGLSANAYDPNTESVGISWQGDWTPAQGDPTIGEGRGRSNNFRWMAGHGSSGARLDLGDYLTHQGMAANDARVAARKIVGAGKDAARISGTAENVQRINDNLAAQGGPQALMAKTQAAFDDPNSAMTPQARAWYQQQAQGRRK